MRRISTRLVLAGCLALLFLWPGNVSAIPLSEYGGNLRHAIAALESLTPSEDESESDYENRYALAFELVRVALPDYQNVEYQGETYHVDNHWLLNELDVLKRMSGEERDNKIRQLVEVLRSIEARVAELQQPGGPWVDSKQQAKTKLESILTRPEYTTGAKGPN